MIAIKYFDMPKSCDDCPFSISHRANHFNDYVFDKCVLTGQSVTCLEDVRHPLCPLVEIEDENII